MTPPADPRFRRLMIVDDEPGIRRMMSLDLTADGYEVCTANDGNHALEVFRRERPDIVLTDLKMPGMDGLTLLAHLKEESPETEVIVITGHGDLDLAVRSLHLDASDFITKPINPDALEVSLARASERLAMRAELKAYTEDLHRRVDEATAKVLAAERLAVVGQTVASLAHSIKNMLCGLKGGIYMVKQGLSKNEPERTMGGQQMMERNLNRVDRLVRDLLTLSKPREPELDREDAGDLLREAAMCMKSEAEAKGVVLEVKEAGGELSCRVDRQAVIDSLNNLISNALDAAATVTDGRVRLGVEPRKGEVAWEVEDNGPGLDQEAQEHIFEGFYSSKGAGGTGLGLMVTQKNAREHRGRVEYDNRPGKGAVFRLVLPRLAASGGNPAPKEAGPRQAAPREECSHDQL
jgi:signal transduction histidine kinase